MDYVKELDAIVKKHIGPAVRDAGFAGSGSHYRRVTGDDLLQVVSIERGARNTADWVTWTYNIGFAGTRLGRAGRSAPDSKRLRAEQCAHFLRFGQVLAWVDDAPPCDYWYDMMCAGLADNVAGRRRWQLEHADEAEVRRTVARLNELRSRYDPTKPREAARTVADDLARYVVGFVDRVRTQEDVIAIVRETRAVLHWV